MHCTGMDLAVERHQMLWRIWLPETHSLSCNGKSLFWWAGTGSGEASEEDAAGGRRSSRVKRPNVRTVDAASELEPGPSNRHNRFPSRLRATVSRWCISTL